MRLTAYITLIYGILVFLLGVMGYTHAGSLISLFAGGGLGLLVFICALFMIRQIKAAYWIALGLTVVLSIFFVYRLYSSISLTTTFNFMPAAMGALSFLVIILILIRIFKVNPSE